MYHFLDEMENLVVTKEDAIPKRKVTTLPLYTQYAPDAPTIQNVSNASNDIPLTLHVQTALNSSNGVSPLKSILKKPPPLMDA